MTPDDRLKQALGLGAEAPPEVDHLFTARLAERIERRRLMLRLAVAGVWAGAAALLGWVLVAAASPAWPALGSAAQLTGLALLIAWVAWQVVRMDLGRLAGQARRAFQPMRF